MSELENLKIVLELIQDGYQYEVFEWIDKREIDCVIRVPNPDYQPDNGSNPFLTAAMHLDS